MPVTDTQPTLLVVGGGAAGMLAALAAARAGARVTLLERNNQLGRKLLVTGNGRCNLSHNPICTEAYCGDRAFIEQFVARWPTAKLVELLAQLGLACDEEEGRLYPRSRRADSVTELLTAQLTAAGVTIVTNCPVVGIARAAAGFVVTTQDRTEYCAPRLLLTAGGPAGPQYGATDDGYGWLRGLGHTVAEPRPVLVPMRMKVPHAWRPATGQKAIVRATLLADARELMTLTDELLVVDRGLSGPVIMNLSVAWQPGAAHELLLNFMPHDTQDDVAALLAATTLPLATVLAGHLPRALAAALAAMAGDAGRKCWRDLTDGQKSGLVQALTATRLTIDGLDEDWRAAKVTAGGVATGELEPDTLASRVMPGLYVAGELLDIVGISGGHNLHLAFATGWQAGTAAAR